LRRESRSWNGQPLLLRQALICSKDEWTWTTTGRSLVDSASAILSSTSLSLSIVSPLAPKAVAHSAKSGLVSWVAAWYGRYDQDLAAAIQDNQTVQSLREENASNGYELCRQGGDYQSCENRRRAEYIGQRHDQYTISRNVALEVRTQHVFMKVRNGLMRYNLHYDWFKIRTTNGIDVF